MAAAQPVNYVIEEIEDLFSIDNMVSSLADETYICNCSNYVYHTDGSKHKIGHIHHQMWRVLCERPVQEISL